MAKKSRNTMDVEQYREYIKKQNSSEAPTKNKRAPKVLKTQLDEVGQEELKSILEEYEFSTDEVIFISGNVPSQKNSEQIYWKKMDKHTDMKIRCFNQYGKQVVPFISKSDIVQEYRKATKEQFMTLKSNWQDLTNGSVMPYRVEMIFIRDTKRIYDHHNAIQVIADSMEYYGWIPEDDTKNLLIYPPLDRTKPVEIINQNCPGVIIRPI